MNRRDVAEVIGTVGSIMLTQVLLLATIFTTIAVVRDGSVWLWMLLLTLSLAYESASYPSIRWVRR